jgi:hypothetical protein
MHYSNGYAHEQAERDEPLLLVGKPIVFKRERRSREHLRRINEVQPVGFQIGFALILIPLVLHLRSVYTHLTQRKPSPIVPVAAISALPTPAMPMQRTSQSINAACRPRSN